MARKNCTGNGSKNRDLRKSTGMVPSCVEMGSGRPVWLELNLARDAKSNKKGLCTYVSQKRKDKERCTPSMNIPANW